MAKKKDKLVPYDQVSPGFEAAYTGETSSTPVRENQMTSTLYSDEDGNLIDLPPINVTPLEREY
jgi:hypothetical protein